ncbi:MAG: hypothetical protein FVQ79_13630 [Planctomycetes bacterium]|nr:hypothetical protein [Planctomycetota bacterium]
MADLTNIELVRNGSVDFTWGNDGAASQTIPLIKRDEKFILMAQNTDALLARIKIAAGAFSGKALGFIYKDLNQDEMSIFGPLSGSRFKNADGDLEVLITNADYSPFSGTITNVKLSVIELP